MIVVCRIQDCIHNWCGGKCSLKRIAISKDLTCQNYHQTNQEATVKQEEKSILIMDRIKLRRDSDADWNSPNNEPNTKAHAFHEDWKENVFETQLITGENKI